MIWSVAPGWNFSSERYRFENWRTEKNTWKSSKKYLWPSSLRNIMNSWSDFLVEHFCATRSWLDQVLTFSECRHVFLQSKVVPKISSIFNKLIYNVLFTRYSLKKIKFCLSIKLKNDQLADLMDSKMTKLCHIISPSSRRRITCLFIFVIL